jgi:hypothetical protein
VRFEALCENFRENIRHFAASEYDSHETTLTVCANNSTDTMDHRHVKCIAGCVSRADTNCISNACHRAGA